MLLLSWVFARRVRGLKLWHQRFRKRSVHTSRKGDILKLIQRAASIKTATSCKRKAKPTSLAFSRSLITFPDSQYNTSIPTEILIKFHHADQRLLTRGPLDWHVFYSNMDASYDSLHNNTCTHAQKDESFLSVLDRVTLKTFQQPLVTIIYLNIFFSSMKRYQTPLNVTSRLSGRLLG